MSSVLSGSTSSGLLERVRERDADAWRRLAKLYTPLVYRWARHCNLQSSDAADYTVWRDMLGQSGTGLVADGNGDTMITDLDYNVWKSNFGQTAGSGSLANVAVPEPAALLIAVAAGLITLLWRHRRT
jgi:hypothetical protein